MRVATVAAIILLGFALRLVRLTHLGDLEFDEIVSVRYASLPPQDLLPRLAGALFEHPPAFYLALGGWRTALGEGGPSEVVARLFSVFPGTLLVPLTYAVARRLYRGAVADLAALAVAVAPLPLFYSREVRMYALVTALGLASLWLFLRAIDRPFGHRAWLAYTLAGTASAYVHYLGALLLCAQAAAALVLRRRVPHLLRPVLSACAVVLILAAPWLVAAGGVRASLPALSAANVYALPAAMVAALCSLAGGPDATGPAPTVAAAALVGLAALGFPREPTRRAAVGATLLAGAGGVTFAVMLGKPFEARYILPVAPLLYVMATAGLARLWQRRCMRFALPLPAAQRGHRGARPAALASVLALLLGAGPFWSGYYLTYTRADYSDVTRRIATLERAGDGVLLTGPWQAWYFDYYYTGRLDHAVLPRDAPPALDPTEAAAELEQLAARYRRLWFVQAGLAQADPTSFVERWLQQHAWPASREAHANAVLSLYALQPPERTRPLRSAIFGESLRLAGGWIDADEVPAGDVLRLSLELRLLQPEPRNLKASLRLVGADGQRTAVDFDLVDMAGGTPVPVSRWEVGQTITLRRGLLVPAGMGPQPYSVRLVVYDPATLAPLAPAGLDFDLAAGAAAAGGEVPIAATYVTQSLAGLAPDAEEPFQPIGRRFGGGDEFDTLDLAGVRWRQADPTTGPLAVDLLWQLEGVSGTEHRSTVTVVDGAGRVWAQQTRPLFGGSFAMWDWRSGETLAERRYVDLRALPAGRYRIAVGLEDARGRHLPIAGRAGTAEEAVEIGSYTLPYRRPWPQRLAGALGALRQMMAQYGPALREAAPWNGVRWARSDR